MRSIKLLFFLTLILFTGVYAVFANNKTAAGILSSESDQDGIITIVGEKNIGSVIDASKSGNYLVHILVPDKNIINQLKHQVEKAGQFDGIKINYFYGRILPYPDDYINLLIIEEDESITRDEALRVLVPNGTVYFPSGKKEQKPWPSTMDEWSHRLHSPDGNAVARDKEVGPPAYIQWINEPVWMKHHDLVPSVSALVSANGRIFYIVDNSEMGITEMPGEWSLTARDAFNGKLLWKKPINEWGWDKWSDEEVRRFNQPTHIAKRLVADDKRVFCTLGFNAPISSIDASNGEVTKVYEGTKHTSEFIYINNKLIAAVSKKKNRPAGKGEGVANTKLIKCIDADTGNVLWKSGEYAGVSSRINAIKSIKDVYLTAGDEYVFFADGSRIICLDIENGEERWSFKRPSTKGRKLHFGFSRPNLLTFVYHNGILIVGQPNGDGGHYPWNAPYKSDIYAVSAESGKMMWKTQGGTWGHSTQCNIWVINNEIWVNASAGFNMRILDPVTGKVKRTVSAKKALDNLHHHRCYRDKATENYILTARRGVEFINRETGYNRVHHWVRGTCLLGIVPCNGLLYAPPDPCICYSTAKLNGFFALAPEGKNSIKLSSENNLQKGPLYNQIKKNSASKPAWPAYRGDNKRSGCSSSEVPEDIRRVWSKDLGGIPTAPVSGSGIIVVSVPSLNKVYGLNENSGSIVWEFRSSGGADSPPAIYNNLAIFGTDDGYVYALHLADGKLVWKFTAAPAERFILDKGKLTSCWKVHGSVLVLNDAVFFAAGRSSFVDTGIYLYKLDAFTGKELAQKVLYTPDENGEMKPYKTGKYSLPKDDPGALADILVSDGASVFMRHVKIDPAAISKTLTSAGPKVHTKTDQYLHTIGGLLDDSWFNQSYWSITGHRKSRAHYLIYNDNTIYGIRAFYGRKGMRTHSRSVFKPGSGYTLFAYDRKTKKELWSKKVPIRVKAMVKSGNDIFIAGIPDEIGTEDPWSAFKGEKGALLWKISGINGEKLEEYKLDSIPVFDSMIISGNKLMVSSRDNKITCWSKGSVKSSMKSMKTGEGLTRTATRADYE